MFSVFYIGFRNYKTLHFFKRIIKARLPHGQEKSGNQEKSGKNKKNDKSQEKSGKNGSFCKKSGKVRKKVYEKHQILSVQIYKIPYI